MSTTTTTDEIYILGLGNLGKYVAHGLAQVSPRPSITLLFHRASQSTDWETSDRSIECTRNGLSVKSTGYNTVPLWEGASLASGSIKNLIVATKAYHTSAALRPLQHCLGNDSNVLFLQNGMGPRYHNPLNCD